MHKVKIAVHWCCIERSYWVSNTVASEGLHFSFFREEDYRVYEIFDATFGLQIFIPDQRTCLWEGSGFIFFEILEGRYYNNYPGSDQYFLAEDSCDGLLAENWDPW